MATLLHSSKPEILKTTINTKHYKLSSVKRTMNLIGSRLTQGSSRRSLRSYWLTLASSAPKHSRCLLLMIRKSASSKAAGISLHQKNRSPIGKRPVRVLILASFLAQSLRNLILITSRMCSSNILSTRRTGMKRRRSPMRRSYSPSCQQTTRIWRA
jgi:hypothetical protein